MQKSKKTLPTVVPPIYGYLVYAFPLSIVLSYEEAWPWFYCNFMQLSFFKDSLTNPLTFYYNDFTGARFGNLYFPNIDYQIVDRDLLPRLNLDIIELIKRNIDMEYYCIFHWDEYFVPDSDSYNKDNYKHRAFIYGYDDQAESFNTYFYSSSLIYQKGSISYSALKQAYNIMNPVAYENNNYFLKYNNKEYKFDLNCIYDILGDYLYSRNTSERYRCSFNTNNNFVYGLDLYECLCDYYAKATSTTNNYVNHKPLHILWEHKSLMLQRFMYINKNKYLTIPSSLISEYQEVEKIALLLRNKYLKYSVSKDPKQINNLIIGLKELKILEKNILGSILECF